MAYATTIAEVTPPTSARDIESYDAATREAVCV
jgi:hypothetical protein